MATNPLKAIFGPSKAERELAELRNQQAEQRRRAKRVVERIKKDQLFRTRQEINTWREALTVAEDVFTPDRTELMRTFQDIVLDDHLKSVMTTRVNAAISGSFFLYQDGQEEHDEELSEALRSEWFDDFMRLVVESRFWGYSLIQLGDVKGMGFSSITCVPRQYVDPVRRGVKPLLYATDDAQLVPIDKPPFRLWTILVGKEGDMGLINEATPLVIWKKNALQFWSQFGELFGIPWRVGKTDVADNVRRTKMAQMLETSGAAPWAVIDIDDMIEFIEHSQSDAFEVFDKMAERSDKGISKLILGQTMTTENGSSRSQAEVHERVMDELIRGDKKYIERIVNNDLLPRMSALGMIPEGVTFKWDQEESLDFEQRLKGIEILARSGFKISPEKVEELTGIPVEEKEVPPGLQPGQQQDDDLADRLEEINNLYIQHLNPHSCDH